MIDIKKFSNFRSELVSAGHYVVHRYHPLKAEVINEYEKDEGGWFVYYTVRDQKFRHKEAFNQKGPALEFAKALLDQICVQYSYRKVESQPAQIGFKQANQRMTKKEALEVLGLTDGASPEIISQRHKKLAMSLHPDMGGSQFLMVQINLAKEVLTPS